MIPWIPLLTMGAQFLGGVMGKTANQSENQATNSIINGVTGQTSAGVTRTTQTQNQTQNQETTDLGSGQTNESVDRLDTDTKNLLTQQVQKLLATSGGGSAAIQQELESISKPGALFDGDAFVKGIMQSANANASSDFGSGVNNIRGKIGANSGSNSMAALLEAKLRDQTTASLAGVESQARGQAAQIKQNDLTARSGAITNLSTGSNNELQTMLSSLINAGEKSTGTSTTKNVGATHLVGQNTGSEEQRQDQSTLGTTRQTTDQNTVTNGKTQEQDWTKLMSTLAGAFGATF